MGNSLIQGIFDRFSAILGEIELQGDTLKVHMQALLQCAEDVSFEEVQPKLIKVMEAVSATLIEIAPESDAAFEDKSQLMLAYAILMGLYEHYWIEAGKPSSQVLERCLPCYQEMEQIFPRTDLCANISQNVTQYCKHLASKAVHSEMSDTLRALHRDWRLNISPVGFDPFDFIKTFMVSHLKANPDFSTFSFHDMLAAAGNCKEVIHQNDVKPEGIMPYRIHEIWLDGVPSKTCMDNVKSIKRHNPNYNVVIYVDDKCHELPEYKAFQAECQEAGLLIVPIDSVICDSPFYPLFCLMAYTDRIYQSSCDVPGYDVRKLQIYGSASSIARLILLLKYRGCYIDMPDVSCHKPFPHSLRESMTIRKLSPEVSSNDVLVVSDHEGEAVARDALSNIAKNLFCGYAFYGDELVEMQSDKVNIITSPNYVRVGISTQTVGAGALSHVQCSVRKPGFFEEGESVPAKSILDSLQCGLVGVWHKSVLEEIVLSDHISKDELSEIKGVISHILFMLNRFPYVLVLDRYPLLRDDRHLAVVLDFMHQVVPKMLELVKNVVANTLPNPEVLFDRLSYFPNLYTPYIHVLCKTKADTGYEAMQIQHIEQYLRYMESKDSSESLSALDRHDNLPFTSACRNGNFSLAQVLFTKLTAEKLTESQIQQALEYCFKYRDLTDLMQKKGADRFAMIEILLANDLCQHDKGELLSFMQEAAERFQYGLCLHFFDTLSPDNQQLLCESIDQTKASYREHLSEQGRSCEGVDEQFVDIMSLFEEKLKSAPGPTSTM